MSYGQFSRFSKGKRSLADLRASAEAAHPGRALLHLKRVANNTIRFQLADERGERVADIVYHLQDTDILTLYGDGRLTLNSDGWQTVTTKERLNRFLPAGFSVFSDGGWHVRTPAGTFPYADKVTFKPDGNPTDWSAIAIAGEAVRIKADKKLIAAWLKKLKAEGWSNPGGDPWIAPDERGLFPADTVREWLRDGYVTRLVVEQALTWAGYRDPAYALRLYTEGGNRLSRYHLSPVRRFLKACLRIGA